MNNTVRTSSSIGASVPERTGAASAAPVPGARGRRRARPASGQWVAWGFLAPVSIYLLAFYAYPLYRNLDLSLREYTVRSFVQGGAPFAGLHNFTTVVTDPNFLPAMWHTIIFTLTSIVFQFAAGMGLAVFFYRHFRLSRLLRALFLVPWLLPLIVSASTWAWMFDSDSGIVNAALHLFGISPVNWLTAPGWSLASVTIANIWIGVPFNLALLYSGLQGIPGSLYEAAAIDGVNGWQKFWRITFPLLRPVSAITLLLGLIYTLKVFDIIWIMTRGGPANSSATLSTWSYQLGFGNIVPRFSPAAAIGDLLIVVALIFGLFYIRLQRKQNQA
jgi:multiple sugar transport system permease protein